MVCHGLAQSAREATLDIRLLDSFGKSLGKITVIECVDSKGRTYAGRFKDGRASNIPFGEYTITFRANQGGILREQVYVDRDDYLLVVAMDTAILVEFDGRGPAVRGAVRGLPDDVPMLMWVKVCGLFLDGCRIAKLDSSYSFVFPQLANGTYTLFLLSESRELVTERIEIHDRSSFIEINAGNQTGHSATVRPLP